MSSKIRYLLCWSLIACAPLFAQTISGSITGRVLDPSEEIVPGASITVTNDETGDKQSTTANQIGLFTFPSLRPGVYSVRIEQQAFQTYERVGMKLSANEHMSLGDIKLKVGAVTQKVTVAAQGSQVQTAGSEHSAELTANQINMIQVRGRDVVALLRLLPGVTNTGDIEAVGDGSGTTMPTVQGLQSSAFTTLSVDGVTGNTLGNVNSNGAATNLDAIGEVTVMLNNYQAEYGRNGGASINVVTKSGTKTFHGGAYWYKRHEMFNANDFFSNQNGLAKSIYRYNTIGGTVGGPLYIPQRFNRNKDKLFFFYSTEHWDSWTPRPLSQVTVPTALERQGNFSQTLDLNGQVIAIKDPTNGSPFPGNVVPSSRLDKNGQALLNLFPLPNMTDRSISKGNYNYNFPNSWQAPKRNHLGKLDFHPTDKDRISVRLSHWSADLVGQGVSAGFNGGWPMLSMRYRVEDDGLALNYTRTISPSMVNEFNGGARHMPANTSPTDPAALNRYVRSNIGMTLGQFYPQTNELNLIPQASFGGVPNAAALTYDPRTFLAAGETTFNYSDNFSWIRGAHALKFGIFADRGRANKGNSGNFGGTFAFARDVNNPLDSNYAYANAVMGVYDSYSEDQHKPSANERQTIVEWFAQDTWKATRRLTFDIGMRFGWTTPWYIKDGKSAGFSLDRYNTSNAPLLFQPALNSSGVRVGRNPVNGQLVPAVLIGSFVPNTGNVINGMVQGTDPNYPTGFMRQQGIHPEPRFGLAYDVFGDGSTAIRAAVGITHVMRTSSNAPNTQARINPPQQFSPITYYGTMDALVGAAGYLTPTTVYGWDINTKTPAIYNYTFGVQRKLLGTIIDASYVGNMARHLTQTRNLDLVPYGARFLPQNADPTNPKVPLSDKFFNPLPGYTDVNYVENAGSSNYNSLQVTANRRFTTGLQFGASYTWSKAMDYADYDWTNTVATYRPVRVWNYGKSTVFDQTHNLGVNFIYDLPSVASQHRLVHKLIDGWQLAGFASFASGIPAGIGYTLVDGADITAGGDGGRIVVTGKAPLDAGSRSFSQWFNTGVFARPAKGDYGNAPKDVFRRPGINNWDTSLFKNVPLGNESRSLQFRWEMYNVFNHTQFANVDSTARFDATGKQVNARFGQVISTRTPRVCQAAIRFTF